MASIEATTAQAIALMQATGEFYLRARDGLKPALWKKAERRSFAPVLKDSLCTWLEDRDVENPYSTAIAVLKQDFTNEFPPLDDETLELVSEKRRRHA